MTMPTAGFTAGSDEHDTPPGFIRPVATAVEGFDLDPSASATSEIADENLTKDDDGLSQPWHGKVYLNPPYSNVGEWLKYAVTQHQHGHTDLIVALVFARTSTQWFHGYATTADLWCFVEGRLRFGDADNTAPAPSLVAVWGDYPDELRDVLERKGEVVEL